MSPRGRKGTKPELEQLAKQMREQHQRAEEQAHRENALRNAAARFAPKLFGRKGGR